MLHNPDAQVIIVTGPTASGKTALAVETARRLGTEVVCADSRQFYKDMPVVTAAPSIEEQKGVRHHFLEFLPLDGYFNAAMYAAQARVVIERLVAEKGHAVVCGGSLMYIDALTQGIDALPDISDEVRQLYAQRLRDEGIKPLLSELQSLDPQYYGEVDHNNWRRVVHALELIAESGKKVSELRAGAKNPLPYSVEWVMPQHPRDVLFDRINRRVVEMWRGGMETEARDLYTYRHLNSTNTIGLKEWFAFFDAHPEELSSPIPSLHICPWDGKDTYASQDFPHTRASVLARIAKNTRVYAKKQLTWLNRSHR